MTKENLPEGAAPNKDIPEDAKRALQEAEERRKQRAENTSALPNEIHGPKGEEPTRHGDWERKGIAYDF